MSRKLGINGRTDEAGNRNSYQITFRTTRELSARWSSLRGLCKKFGKDEVTPELFERVVLPAMREYVWRMGYVENAKRARAEAANRPMERAEAKLEGAASAEGVGR